MNNSVVVKFVYVERPRGKRITFDIVVVVFDMSMKCVCIAYAMCNQ